MRLAFASPAPQFHVYADREILHHETCSLVSTDSVHACCALMTCVVCPDAGDVGVMGPPMAKRSL
jgi:hypothetical protein